MIIHLPVIILLQLIVTGWNAILEKFFKTKMMLSDFGKIAFDLWCSLSSRFPCFQSHIFQIMPNHLHAIV